MFARIEVSHLELALHNLGDDISRIVTLVISFPENQISTLSIKCMDTSLNNEDTYIVPLLEELLNCKSLGKLRKLIDVNNTNFGVLEEDSGEQVALRLEERGVDIQSEHKPERDEDWIHRAEASGFHFSDSDISGSDDEYKASGWSYTTNNRGLYDGSDNVRFYDDVS